MITIHKARAIESEPRYHLNKSAIINGRRATITDISQEGVYLSADHSLRLGEKVDIYWNQDGEDFKVSGVVVLTHNKTEQAVRLVHTQESSHKIEVLLNQLHSLGLIKAERSLLKNIKLSDWINNLAQRKDPILVQFDADAIKS